MTRIGLVLAVVLLGALPLQALAATVASDRTLVLSDSPADNAYLSGTDVTVTAPLPADIAAAGGTLTLLNTVAGDALLAGGTVLVNKDITGDLRAVGAQVTVNGNVGGDLMLAGGSVVASTSARDARIIGGNVRLAGGGEKTMVFGATVELSGVFAGDVEVVASDRLTLAEGTVIHGALKYDAPQQAGIPATAVIDGGVDYTGAASYLPTIEQAKTFAIAGAGVLFVVRIIALLILAGLLAGLFPVFSQLVADRALSYTPGRFVLLALLGFAIVVAAPVLILFLAISFVGIALAFVLGAAYVLLLALGYAYAGILAGSALSRGLLKQPLVTWKVALVGMLVLYLIGSIPVLGGLVTCVLFLAATGAILSIAYNFSFARHEPDVLSDITSE